MHNEQSDNPDSPERCAWPDRQKDTIIKIGRFWEDCGGGSLRVAYPLLIRLRLTLRRKGAIIKISVKR